MSRGSCTPVLAEAQAQKTRWLLRSTGKGDSLVDIGGTTSLFDTLLLGLSELGNVAVHGVEDDSDFWSHCGLFPGAVCLLLCGIEGDRGKWQIVARLRSVFWKYGGEGSRTAFYTENQELTLRRACPHRITVNPQIIILTNAGQSTPIPIHTPLSPSPHPRLFPAFPACSNSLNPLHARFGLEVSAAS